MEFDYVIVGGGSAGATLAGRLTQDASIRVCLLEAGGDGRDLLIRTPAAVVAMVPGRPKINNWSFNTEPQTGLNGRRGYQPRGKALGGSSAINAMLYVRGHASDYNQWAELGCRGWSFDEVLPYFIQSENNERGADSFHGDSGPLSVSEQRSPRPISYDFIEAAKSFSYPLNTDFNGAQQEGVGLYQVTQFRHADRNGQRCSAAAAYLHPVQNRPNLHVITHARASQIVFEGKRASAVRYQHHGKSQTVQARREVLLCGGAFNSPQLLQLSGVGRADDLKQLGISLVHDLPGVGQNLQDHLDFVLSFKSRHTELFGLGVGPTITLLRHVLQWRKNGTGMLATPYAEAGAFLKSDPALSRPDLQLHFVIGIVDDHARKLHWGYGFSCHVCVLRPHSRGAVFLRSADPMADPGIDPKFLSDPRDLDLMVKGARMMREIVMSPVLAKYRHRELHAGPVETDEQIAEHIRARADTIYHPVGSCKMGIDDMAVVDPELKVHGLEGLRVVDASIMPTLIGGNTNAPTMMIAEKAADMILGKPALPVKHA